MDEVSSEVTEELEQPETEELENIDIEKEKLKKLLRTTRPVQPVPPPPPPPPPPRKKKRRIDISQAVEAGAAAIGLAGVAGTAVVLKNVTERVDDEMMKSISESILSGIKADNAATGLAQLSDNEVVKKTLTQENSVNFGIQNGLEATSKATSVLASKGITASNIDSSTLNLNANQASYNHTNQNAVNAVINDVVTADASDTTTFDIDTDKGDISSGRNQKFSVTYDDGILKNVQAVEADALYSLKDGMSLTGKVSQETAVKGVSIAQSITQGVNLKRNGASYTVAQDNVLNVGKNTSFSTNDTTTVDATTTGVSVENKKSARAAYDNGHWHQSLTAEGSTKVGFPDGVEAKGKITHKMGTENLSIADSISGNIKANIKGVSAGVSHDTTINAGKNVTISGSDSTNFNANFQDASISRSIKGSVGYDDGTINDKVTVSADGKASIKDGISGSIGAEHTYGVNGVVSATDSVKGKASYDGKKATFGVDAGSSVTYGDEDYNVQQSTKSSYSVSSDGTQKIGGEISESVKMGPVESSSSVSAQKTYAEDKESSEVEMKSSHGVQMTQGAKLTSEVSVKNSESVEVDSENNTVTESESTEIKTKTRIELDREKASGFDVAMAAVVNTTAAITETITNEAMKFEDSTTTKLDDGEDEEAAMKEAEEAQAEAEKEIEKQNQETQKELEQEEEKSIKEQVEEDTRVNEELNRQSEEMMEEHENAMTVDREEYAAELEDYSYEQEGEGESGLESVNFSEGEGASQGGDGESADNSYDCAYGY